MKLLTDIWNFIKSPGPMAIVAIGGVIFGIYGTLFYERQAALSIELVSNNPVFDIRTDVSKLGVTYAGVDLRKSSQTLRLLSIKISNTGSKDILKSDFDEGEPISLTVSDGKVVEVSRVDASNDFLQKRARVQFLAETSIQVSPALLEKNEYLVVNFLVLSDLGKTPSVKATGKIVGIKHFEFKESPVAPKISLVSDIFHAESFLSQLLRGPAYFIFFFFEIIVVVLMVALPLAALQTIVSGIKRFIRERVVKKKFFGRNLSDSERVALEYYLDQGDAGLSHIYKLLDNLKKREEIISKFTDEISEHDRSKHLSDAAPLQKKEISFLQNENMLTVNGLKIEADVDFEAGVNRVCSRLQLDPEHIRALSDKSRFGPILTAEEVLDMSMVRKSHLPRQQRAITIGDKAD